MVLDTIAYLVWFAVPFAALLAVAYWTYADASARGNDRARVWGAGVVLTLVAAPIYLLVRRDLGDRSAPPSRGERLAVTFVFGAVIATPLTLLFAPGDPMRRVRIYPLSVLAGLAIAAGLGRSNVLTRIRRQLRRR